MSTPSTITLADGTVIDVPEGRVAAERLGGDCIVYWNDAPHHVPSGALWHVNPEELNGATWGEASPPATTRPSRTRALTEDPGVEGLPAIT